MATRLPLAEPLGGASSGAGAGGDGGRPTTTSSDDCSGSVEAVNLYLMIDAETSMIDRLNDTSCDVSNYSTASVDIGPIADVSTAIASQLEDYAVVLLTDGYPTQCEPQEVTAMVELVAASYGDAPSVP